MDSKINILIGELGENRVKQNIDLTEYLLTGLGGPAKVFYIATSSRELIKSVELCRELKLDFLVIGSGSKIALSQTGINGLAIKNRCDNIKIFGIKGKVSRLGIGIEEASLEVESGVSLQKLSQFSREQNLTGFEILRSTPGTVGGSLYINQTLRDKVYQVRVLTEDGKTKIKDLPAVSREDIILAVVFRLRSKT